MEIIHLDNLESINVKLLAAYSYRPKILKNFINYRKYSAIVYVLKGKYLYKSGRETIILTQDSAIYLPPNGDDYSYEVLDEHSNVLQIDFMLLNGLENQVAISSKPMKLNVQMERLKILMQKLMQSTDSDTPSSRLELKSRLTLLLSILSDKRHIAPPSKAEQKIAPAIEFLQKKYYAHFDSKELASYCDLSESQLRRLFKKTTGLSPLEYRNAIRMNVANELLSIGELNISEIAFAIGFDDIYAFSHFFKKYKGISPSKYKDELM